MSMPWQKSARLVAGSKAGARVKRYVKRKASRARRRGRLGDEPLTEKSVKGAWDLA